MFLCVSLLTCIVRSNCVVVVAVSVVVVAIVVIYVLFGCLYSFFFTGKKISISFWNLECHRNHRFFNFNSLGLGEKSFIWQRISQKMALLSV